MLQRLPVRVPHKAQAIDNRVFRPGRVGRTEHEDADNQNNSDHKQQRQGPLTKPLNSPADAETDHGDVDGKCNQKENIRGAESAEIGIVRAAETLVAGQKCAHLGRVSAGGVLAGDGENAVAQQPGFDVSVIRKYHHRAENADGAEVLDKAVFLPHGLEDAGRSAMLKAAAKTPDGPFDPHQRQPQKQKRNEIRNHEDPAPVMGGQTGETQKVAQPHGAAGNRENHPQFRTPSFSNHCILSFVSV